MKKILTICGGFSTEREISLITGEEVAKGVNEAGYNSYFIDTMFPENTIKVDSHFEYKTRNTDIDNKYDSITLLINSIRKINPDKVFIGLHGGEGENGEIQALLSLLGIPYTGSNTKSSAIGMDKNISKMLIKQLNIPTSKWENIDSEIKIDELKKIIEKDYGYPVVFKANSQGSSVGVDIFYNESELKKAEKMFDDLDDTFMIEQYVKGRELSIPVIKGKAYPPIEIIPHEKFYDYEHKYKEGITDHICPAELNDKEIQTLNEYAVKIYHELGFKDYVRVDFILNEVDNQFYFLEANTLPGMTKLSLVPESALACGIEFKDLMKLILED